MSPLPAARCPKCEDQPELLEQELGATQVQECTGCRGLWIDRASFERLRDSRAVRSATLELLANVPPGPAESVRYYPCPRCDTPMHRLNFGQVSGVILDQCRSHGIWFDANELRQIIAFLDAGGMDRAREQERQLQERERAKLRAANQQRLAGNDDDGLDAGTVLGIVEFVVSVVGLFLD